MDEVIKYMLFDVSHGVFFLGIFTDFRDPSTSGMYVILMNSLNICISNLCKVIVVENQLISPCPLIFAIIAINLFETVCYFLNSILVATFLPGIQIVCSHCHPLASLLMFIATHMVTTA